MKIIILILCGIPLLIAETLFEVKDASDHTVLDVSTDGLRVMNYPDTLMIISSSEIQANVSSSKGLSRSFSVATSTSKGSDSDIMKVTADSTRIWVKDVGKGFQISSSSALAKAASDTSYMNVDNKNTFLGLGAGYRINPNVSYDNGNKYNTMFGYQAGFNTFGTAQVQACFNIFVGYKSGFSNTTGEGNIFIGNKSGYSGMNNANNTFLGNNTGEMTTNGDGNTYIGNSAGRYNTSGGVNTFVGRATGESASGSSNSYFGLYSGNYFAGSYNTFLGTMSAYSYWGNGGTGDNNVMVGYKTGTNSSSSTNNFTGSNNVMLGSYAGSKNIAGTWSGTGNVLLGYQAGSGTKNYSNKLFIENSNADSTAALIWGDFVNNKLKFNGSVQVKNGTEIGKVQAGIKTIGSGGSGVNIVALTFPAAFASVPKVCVTPINEDGINDIVNITVRNITTSSCVLLVYRLDSPGGGWGQNLKADWIAWE